MTTTKFYEVKLQLSKNESENDKENLSEIVSEFRRVIQELKEKIGQRIRIIKSKAYIKGPKREKFFIKLAVNYDPCVEQKFTPYEDEILNKTTSLEEFVLCEDDIYELSLKEAEKII